MAISGITFENQLVTHKDDGMFHDWMIGGDGFIAGCELTYLGMDLFISPGYMCIAGRLLKVVTSETVTLGTEVTDGYARLKLTIDTSQISSEAEFGQVDLSWDYSGTTNFPELTQEEINDDGIIYEFEVCVLSTTTGGITGITSQADVLNGASRPRLLWEGSWSAGNITVPGLSNYRLLLFQGTSASNFFIAWVGPTEIRGGSSISSRTPVLYTLHFVAGRSGDVLTYSVSKYLGHSPSGGHGSDTDVPIAKIYGLM
jgi:hypothetical protein